MDNSYSIENTSVVNKYGIKNNIITKAEYDYYYKGKKVKYESDYVSIIDIPYRKYRLV